MEKSYLFKHLFYWILIPLHPDWGVLVIPRGIIKRVIKTGSDRIIWPVIRTEHLHTGCCNLLIAFTHPTVAGETLRVKERRVIAEQTDSILNLARRSLLRNPV
jgi:hypothetical protein